MKPGALGDLWPERALHLRHYPKGACVLVLQKDSQNQPIHVVWGIPKSQESPAVLVTAYRPSPDKWESDHKTRKP